ncbi:MAG: hypothetical protein HYW78_00045 [Parcubacteria group bacterium]|nr:hypothetical protein [Parcubacteria group bacterium]
MKRKINSYDRVSLKTRLFYLVVIKLSTSNHEIPSLGARLFEHGYFPAYRTGRSAEKFLVLAPVALAMVQKDARLDGIS